MGVLGCAHAWLKLGLDAERLARLGQIAENRVAGAPCGIMDQMAIAGGRQIGDFPGLAFELNGGLLTLAAADTASAGLAGAMFGRAAYHDPWILASIDEAVIDRHDAACRVSIIPAPLRVSSADVAEILRRESSVRDVILAATAADAAVVVSALATESRGRLRAMAADLSGSPGADPGGRHVGHDPGEVEDEFGRRVLDDDKIGIGGVQPGRELELQGRRLLLRLGLLAGCLWHARSIPELGVGAGNRSFEHG